MSNLIKQIIENRTTRLLFYFYLLIVIFGLFFVTINYFSEKKNVEKLVNARLETIAISAANAINSNLVEDLVEKYRYKDQIQYQDESLEYLSLSLQLSKIQKINKIQTPIYLLKYDSEKDVFQYLCRSDKKVYFLHEYIKYPKMLKTKRDEGGVLPLYESENGAWLSAFQPIKNATGKTVALVEVDQNAIEFYQSVRMEFIKMLTLTLVGIFLIALLLLPLVSKILKKEDAHVQELTSQRDLIAQYADEIQASVRYASSLQNALIQKIDSSVRLDNLVVLNKPKDIVSGDFRWFKETKDYYYISVADCTGHGVPGAMLTVLGSTILNVATAGEKDYKPSEILQNLDDQFSTFINLGSDRLRMEGMDISIVRIAKKNHEVLFAGAKSDLYFMEGDHIERVRGNNYPIGAINYYDKQGFSDVEVHFEQHAYFYLFSDGFPDQFGGLKDKKMGRQAFLNILEQSRSIKAVKRGDFIEKQMNNHQMDAPQVDDMLLISWELVKKVSLDQTSGSPIISIQDYPRKLG